MTSFKFSGTKRTCSEVPCQASFSAPVATATSCTTQNPAADSSGGGSSSTGEVEDEEEPSSSSSSSSRVGSSRSKRFKCALASIRVHTLEDSEGLLPVKEYGRINNEQLEEASKVARSKSGECISKVTIGSGDILGFKCKFGHIFRCSIDDARDKWCVLCTNYYAQCVDFAKNNNGKLLDSKLTTPVTFECSKGHRFTCKTYRTKHLRWCAICKQDEESQKKLQNEQQRAKDSETMIKEQEELFKEARRNLEQEQASKLCQTAIQYEIYLEQIIRQRTAYEVATCGLSETESYWVNKTLVTPMELLIKKWYIRL